MEIAAVRSDSRTTSAATARNRPMTVGRILFGLPIAGFGVLNFAVGDLTTRFALAGTSWVHGRAPVAYVLGSVLVVLGLAIAIGRRARAAALCLAALISLSLLFLYLPRALARPGFGGSWTNGAKYLALIGGALLVAALWTDRGQANPVVDRAAAADPTGVPLGTPRLLLSVFLILGGVQHFVYEDFVATLVPAWIPDHVFWARFAGVALLAAGLGFWVPRVARLAMILAGVMIFIWFLIVHIPRAAASPGDPLEWSGVFESLATSGIAFLLAGSTRRIRESGSRSLGA
jgi:uncharacterized membrane protein YphA (DoxX/SURF4 family)